jgi:hypothetical protein
MPHCCHCSVCLQPSLCHKACLKSSNLSHQVLALLLIASLASQGFAANLRCAVATKLWRPSLRGLGRPSLVGYRTAQPWSRRPSPPLVELRRRASLTKPSQAKPYCTLVLPSPIRPSARRCFSPCTRDVRSAQILLRCFTARKCKRRASDLAAGPRTPSFSMCSINSLYMIPDTPRVMFSCSMEGHRSCCLMRLRKDSCWVVARSC